MAIESKELNCPFTLYFHSSFVKEKLKFWKGKWGISVDTRSVSFRFVQTLSLVDVSIRAFSFRLCINDNLITTLTRNYTLLYFMIHAGCTRTYVRTYVGSYVYWEKRRSKRNYVRYLSEFLIFPRIFANVTSRVNSRSFLAALDRNSSQNSSPCSFSSRTFLHVFNQLTSPIFPYQRTFEDRTVVNARRSIVENAKFALIKKSSTKRTCRCRRTFAQHFVQIRLKKRNSNRNLFDTLWNICPLYYYIEYITLDILHITALSVFSFFFSFSAIRFKSK